MRKHLMIVVALLAMCVGQSAMADSQSVTTSVLGVNAVISRTFSGQVLSEQSAVLSSKLAGQVVAVHAREGDVLKKDAPILDLDDKEQSLRVLSLKQQSAEADGEIEGLAVRIDYAQKNADRLATLAQQGNIARDESDRAQTELGSLKQQEISAKARKASIEAQLAGAQSLLEYAHIRAPFDGVLTRRNVDNGAFVQAGQPLAAIDDARGGTKVEAAVDESLMNRIKIGDHALVLVPTDTGDLPMSSPGISMIVPYIDPTTRSFRIRATLPQDCTTSGAHPLTSGAFARVALPTGEEHRILVPPAAIFNRNGQTVAYVVDNQGAKCLRLIKTGATYRRTVFAGQEWLFDTRDVTDTQEDTRQRFVEVLAGLTPGETVVLQ